MRWIRFASIVFLVAPLFTSTLAAQTGRIEGTVTDEEGAAVPFANVLIEGTHIGAASNVDGGYTIRNVPPGAYTVRASAVGYRAETASVKVTEGMTATHDFTLSEDLLRLEEVVVTGTRTPRMKLESTVAISTISPRELEQAAPRSTTEMLRYIPGFTRVESSGGEVNQNITVRGIYGVELVAFLEDGMPVFPTMHTFFMNADNLFRPDENIVSVEVVRGGNSALFGSSTPGAVINFLNKTGGPEIAGVLKTTGGTGGLVRYDANINGPLGEDWRFNLGGFYRYDRGVRDPGFPGIRGGQFKANITRLLDQGYVRASLKLIDDRNQFILPLPFENPDDPDYVQGFSDFGSMNTIEANRLRLPLPLQNGELEIPLDDGIRTNASWLTAEISFDFPNDWNIHNTAQVMQNDQTWNALVPFDIIPFEVEGQSVLDALIDNGTVPAGSQFQFLFTNHFDGKGNKLPFNTSNGLVSAAGLFHVDKPLTAFHDQLIVTKAIEDHTFTAGTYFAQYSMGNRWFLPNIYIDVRDNPRVLDLVITDPADSVIFEPTRNGFRRYMDFYVNGSGQTSIISLFGAVEIKATDRFRIDIGGRWERNHFYQNSENTSTFDLDGDPATLVDNETWGNQSFRQFDFTFNEWAGNVGINYSVTDQLSAYAQATHGFKMPSLDEYLSPTVAQAALFLPRKTETVEGGLKFSSSRLGASVVGFWGQLRDITAQGAELDADGNTVWVIIPSPKTRTKGVELEVSVSPIPELKFLGSGTYTDAKEGSGADLGSLLAGVPKIIANVAGTYTKSGFTLLADWHRVGSRFLTLQKAGEADDVLKSYNYFNFGATYAFPGQGISVSARLLNAFQGKGFEEGNPRLRQVGGRTSDQFLARPLLPRRLQVSLGYRF